MKISKFLNDSSFILNFFSAFAICVKYILISNNLVENPENGNLAFIKYSTCPLVKMLSFLS